MKGGEWGFWGYFFNILGYYAQWFRKQQTDQGGKDMTSSVIR